MVINNNKSQVFNPSDPADYEFARIELIKLVANPAPIPPGTTHLIAFVDASASPVRILVLSMWVLFDGGVITQPPTCDFVRTDIDVPLGEHSQSKFGGVGYGTEWQAFDLTSAGCLNAKEVKMTFSGTVSPEDPELFAVNGGSSGVGVDLRSVDDVKAIPNSSTPMIWPALDAGERYQFKARYRQTKANVTAGEANAVVTVNFAYE